MSQQIIEIEIRAEDVPLFDSLVAQYGEGDPSKFLKYAIQKVNADRIRTKLRVLQKDARKDMGGKVFTSDQTLQMIKAAQKKPLSEDRP